MHDQNTTSDEREQLPVATFAQAAPYLRRPFTAEAVRFKVQACWPKGAPTKALIVAYVDSRLVTERLNLVIPAGWSDEYESREPGVMMCALTIDGVTRRDVGSGYQGKGLYSDAFKRAAVKFGVGVSLYATPAISLGVADGLKVTGRGDKASLAMQAKAEQRCRRMYSEWLTATGVGMFGAPLDHGDTPESIGDFDTHVPDSDDEAPAQIGADIAGKIVARVWAVPAARDALQLAASHAAGYDVGPVETEDAAAAAVAQLDFAGAEKLDRWIVKKEGEAGE